MPTIPYLHFRGDCAEALALYAQIFGSDPPQMMRYADAPGGDPAWADSPNIVHGQIAIGDGVLMASDYPPGVTGDAPAGFSVMQSAADPAEARRVFDLLVAGGAVINPLGPSFFSPAFGMLRDRYGVTWIISAMPEGGPQT